MSKIFSRQTGVRAAAAMLLAGLLAGCATQKIDWAGRVGQYSYDQAVIEFGPPDKQAKLGDGTVVADWMTRRGQSYTSLPSTVGYPYRYYGPVYPDYVQTSSPDFFLRLIFGPDSQLKSWKKFAR